MLLTVPLYGSTETDTGVDWSAITERVEDIFAAVTGTSSTLTLISASGPALFFAVMVGFVDENSFWDRHLRMEEINSLKAEMQGYQDCYAQDTKALEDLNSSRDAVVRVAREQYLMKYPGEDVYVFIDDASAQQETEADEESL